MTETDHDLQATQTFKAAARLPEPDSDTLDVPETPTSERLRAFEDEKLGKDAPRIHGKVEQGHGSLFQRLSAEDRAHHAALERLVEAEKKVAEARAALDAAEDRHADAADAAGE